MIKTLCLLPLLLGLLAFLSARSAAAPLAPEQWTAPAKWSAQWIMHPETPPQAHAVVHFRRSFELPARPARFVVHVSADNHYRLFVNGRYVTRGPARGDLAHWFYDTLDLSDFLQTGRNTIAAEVINWGPRRSFTYFSEATSFLLQGEGEVEKVANTTAGAWRCLLNPAVTPIQIEWMTDRTVVDFGLYVCGPADRIDAARYPWGWSDSEHDDRTWMPAAIYNAAGGRDTQFAGGVHHTGGRLLVPRRTPLLRETVSPLGVLRRASGIAPDEGFLRDGPALVVPPRTTARLLVDHRTLTLGYPEYTVSGGLGATLRMRYGENLVTRSGAPRGHRDEIEGKMLIGIQDEYRPDGGARRVFKPTFVRAFRYIEIDIATADAALTLERAHQVDCAAPLDLRARFASDDPKLDRLLAPGWRTVSICAQDILLSDAAYEQMQYTGDSRVHNLALFTLSGDDRLTRNALIQFDQSRTPEGLTYACYPNPFHLIIPSYSLIWIDQLHDYLLWRDDPAFFADREPGLHAVLDWFERRVRADGLLGPIEWWPALAWPRHYQRGEPPGVRDGGNTLYSLHYAYTLRHAAELYAYLGRTERAAACRTRADALCSAARRLCRQPDGFFREAPNRTEISQITNLLAILAGAVEGDEARDLLVRLLEPKNWFGQVDTFLHVYLYEALERTGLGDRFAGETRDWQLMLDRGMTTFAEVPLDRPEKKQRSECHPWSAAPNVFLYRIVAGIRPRAPGHAAVDIAPSLGALTRLQATYPHPRGNIVLDLQRTGRRLSGEVEIPAGMEARFTWGGRTIPLRQGRQKIDF